MQVQSLWRYPVKSMQGEQCEELHFGPNGVSGDRAFGVLDVTSGTVISAKRDGRLFEAAARIEHGQLRVALPGEEEMSPGRDLDEALARWLGRPVRLVEADPSWRATFESPNDFENDAAELVRWEGLPGSFVDESALLILGTGDLAELAAERPELQWDVRRFRPNVVVEAAAGEIGPSLSGCRASIGKAEVEVENACTRCVMTTRAQPGLERQLDILRHVIKAHDNLVGMRARIVRAGVARAGDQMTLEAGSPGT